MQPTGSTSRPTCPTLIVWGDRDPIIPLEHGIRAHEMIAGSRLEVFEGAGHFPHCEQPERFVEVLVDFLDLDTAPVDRSALTRTELDVSRTG